MLAQAEGRLALCSLQSGCPGVSAPWGGRACPVGPQLEPWHPPPLSSSTMEAVQAVSGTQRRVQAGTEGEAEPAQPVAAAAALWNNGSFLPPAPLGKVVTALPLGEAWAELGTTIRHQKTTPLNMVGNTLGEMEASLSRGQFLPFKPPTSAAETVGVSPFRLGCRKQTQVVFCLLSTGRPPSLKPPGGLAGRGEGTG